MRAIYFIPIRKGSKGIPGKNMKKLGGKPLVAWAVDSIIASMTADDIWVATDDDMAERFLADAYPEVRVFRRSAWSATDTSPVIDVVLEFIESIRPPEDDVLILAQATSPFTSPDDFCRLCKCIGGNYDSYVACHRVKRFVWHPDGYPISYSLNSKPRRQDYPGILIESGAFYASRVKNIIDTRLLLSGKIRIIETQSDNIDLDEPADWLLAESITNIQPTPNNSLHEQFKI